MFGHDGYTFGRFLRELAVDILTLAVFFGLFAGGVSALPYVVDFFRALISF